MLFRAFLALFAALTIYSAPSYGASAEDQAVDAERDDYDFSWLDPEKKIYVVQNRKYTKAQKFEISTAYGIGMGETYRKQRTWNTRGTFYFNEHWGLSAFWRNNYNSENQDFVALKEFVGGGGVIPAVRDTNQYIGGSVMWLPFYGKINLFNSIFYIDWHFEAGLGSASTEIDLNTRANGSARIETATFGAFHWGSGWKFFITRNWGARLDFLATYYKAPTGLISGGTGAVSGSAEDTYDNYYLTLGIAYTF
ncbi:MAG TPA: outer membrane beta-barrel domain-containing protein [Bdellovibrionota bacterium]|jgi:outer membrane beta-barrel protein